MKFLVSGMTPRDYVEFGVSAFNQPTEGVRRVAERILINLYNKHSKLVRQYLPLETDISPKNIQYRQLFQQFDKIDKEVSQQH
jgi:centrosomal protein CEP104